MKKRSDDETQAKMPDGRAFDIPLSPDQLAELDRCLSDDEPFATEQEALAVLDRLTK